METPSAMLKLIVKTYKYKSRTLLPSLHAAASGPNTAASLVRCASVM